MAGFSWTEQEVATLRQLLKDGRGWSSIGEQLPGRTAKACFDVTESMTADFMAILEKFFDLRLVEIFWILLALERFNIHQQFPRMKNWLRQKSSMTLTAT